MSTGKTALIVEAEFLIALDLQRMLEGLGFSEILLARNVAEGRDFLAQRPDVAVALIEFRLHDPDGLDLVVRLHAKGVPTVAITSDAELRHGIHELAAVPVLGKPVAEDQLALAICRLLGAPA
mgnify:CR=1 FL=1|jgi:Response regulator containing CheY-like receiver and SARP domains